MPSTLSTNFISDEIHPPPQYPPIPCIGKGFEEERKRTLILFKLATDYTDIHGLFFSVAVSVVCDYLFHRLHGLLPDFNSMATCGLDIIGKCYSFAWLIKYGPEPCLKIRIRHTPEFRAKTNSNEYPICEVKNIKAGGILNPTIREVESNNTCT